MTTTPGPKANDRIAALEAQVEKMNTYMTKNYQWLLSVRTSICALEQVAGDQILANDRLCPDGGGDRKPPPIYPPK